MKLNLRSTLIVLATVSVTACLAIVIAECFLSIRSSPRTRYGTPTAIHENGLYQVDLLPRWTCSRGATQSVISSEDVPEASFSVAVVKQQHPIVITDPFAFVQEYGAQANIGDNSYKVLAFQHFPFVIFSSTQFDKGKRRFEAFSLLIPDNRQLLIVRGGYPYDSFLESRVATELWLIVGSIRPIGTQSDEPK